VLEAAASTDVNVLTLSDEQIGQTKRDKLVIPAGTYKGVDTDRDHHHLAGDGLHDHANGRRNGLCADQDLLGKQGSDGGNGQVVGGCFARLSGAMAGKLHPGALKYYDEKGITVPDALR
jgi:hypothetical protein